MPYIINKYNGTLVATVEDGTIDNTLDIKLIGKNYAGYGEVQNENLVHLLENFAGVSEPTKRIAGQVWYDSANKKLKFFDGAKFKTTGGAEVSASEPVGLVEGDFWFKTDSQQLYAWNGTAFVLIGPDAVAGAGTTQMKSISVLDTTATSHPIIVAFVNDQPIYIISRNTFTMATTEDLYTKGFTYVRTGLTLAYTPSNGITTSPDHRYWGTASNADRLGNSSSEDFVLRDGTRSFTGRAKFTDPGYTLGNDDDLVVYIDGVTPTIENVLSDTIVIKTTSSGTKIPIKFVGANTVPGVNNASDLGSTVLRFSTVYATSFNGTATQSDSLNVGGNYRTASTASVVNTIAARDASGDIYANRFEGVAAEAEYADLAEIYETDNEYEVGTVVAVGGEKEVRATVFGDRAIGVISANPAYLMNKDAEGQAIALKGRVPVKVIGAVKKGDRLIATDNGFAILATFHQYLDVFAVALETSSDTNVKLIEAIVL